MRALLAAASMTTALLSGCATPPAEEGKPAEARYYVTGSNVGRRADQLNTSPVMSMSGEEMRKSRSSIPDLTSPSPSGE